MQQRVIVWGGSILTVGLIVWGIAAVPATPSSTGTIPGVASSDHTKGSVTAKAVLVEYSDFQCPACGAFEPVVRQVTEKYGEKLLLVYRHFPLTQLHPNAQMAAQASEAANLQGKFWEFHDLLFDHQNSWSGSSDEKKVFAGYAKELGMNESQFNTDMNSQSAKDRVQTDVQSGTAAQVPGTPTFFLNGTMLSGQRNLKDFSEKIDAILAE